MQRDQLLAKRNDYQTAHTVHLLLSVFTAGVWVPIWLLMTISNANERQKIDKKLDKEV